MLCLSRLGQGIPGLGGFRISSCDPECVQASIEGQPGILQTRKRFFFGGRVRGFTKSSARPLSCREVSALIPTFFSAREMCCQVRIISESGDSGGIPELDLRARRREIYVNPRTIQGRDAEGFPGFEISADSGRFACLARLDIDLSVNAGQSCVRGSRESPPFSHLNRVQAGTFQDPSLQQPVFRERPRGDSG